MSSQDFNSFIDGLEKDRRSFVISWWIFIVSAVIFSITTLWLALFVSWQKADNHVLALDPAGRVVLAPKADRLSDWPDQAFERFVINYIELMRRIDADHDILLSDITRLSALTPSGSPARQKLREQGAGGARSQLHGSSTRSVKIERVEKQSETVWLVVWNEQTKDYGSGRVSEAHRYQASLLLRTGPIGSASALQLNPMGVFVHDFDIQRLIEASGSG